MNKLDHTDHSFFFSHVDSVRIEVFFNAVTPAASGGVISVTLRLIVPETWKDESKPPKPWCVTNIL